MSRITRPISDHIISLLKLRQWFPISQRINLNPYKLSAITFLPISLNRSHQKRIFILPLQLHTHWVCAHRLCLSLCFYAWTLLYKATIATSTLDPLLLTTQGRHCINIPLSLLHLQLPLFTGPFLSQANITSGALKNPMFLFSPIYSPILLQRKTA